VLLILYIDLVAMPAAMYVALVLLLPFVTQAKRMADDEPEEALPPLPEAPGLCCECSNYEDSEPTKRNSPFCVGAGSADTCHQWGDSCITSRAGCGSVDGWNADCTKIKGWEEGDTRELKADAEGNVFMHELKRKQCDEFTVPIGQVEEIRTETYVKNYGPCPENFQDGREIRKLGPYTIDKKFNVQRRSLMDNGKVSIHIMGAGEAQCTEYQVYAKDIDHVRDQGLAKGHENGKCPGAYSKVVTASQRHQLGSYSTTMKVVEKQEIKEEPVAPPPQVKKVYKNMAKVPEEAKPKTKKIYKNMAKVPVEVPKKKFKKKRIKKRVPNMARLAAMAKPRS